MTKFCDKNVVHGALTGLVMLGPGGRLAPCFTMDHNCLMDGKDQHSGGTVKMICFSLSHKQIHSRMKEGLYQLFKAPVVCLSPPLRQFSSISKPEADSLRSSTIVLLLTIPYAVKFHGETSTHWIEGLSLKRTRRYGPLRGPTSSSC